MLTHRPFDNIGKIARKKIKVRYPKGYKHWKQRFESTLRETKGDVNQALEKIHGKLPNDQNGSNSKTRQN